MLGKRFHSSILRILCIQLTSVCFFTANGQTPIPGHAGKIVNGAGGALLNNPNSVFVSGNYAYIASSASNALEIIDISNPAAPVHSGSITDGAGGAFLSNPVSVVVSGNYAYVTSAGSNALEIVDVTDRTNPVHFGSITNGTGGALLSSPSAVFVLGTNAFVTSSASNSLEIIDITDPSAPAHLGSITDGAGGALLNNPTSVYVVGTVAYVTSASNNAIEIIDVTDTTNPAHLGSLIDGTGGALLNAPASLIVSGTNAFVASSGSNAIEIIDVTDPTTPVHLSSLINGGSTILGNALSVYKSGNYLYVASNSGNALEVIDVTDPSAPVHRASLSNGVGGASLSAPTCVVVSGSSAFVTSTNALEVVTLFTPLAPTATAATSVSETGFTATWTNVSNATSFEVDVTTGDFSTYVSGYQAATASGTSLVVSGLSGCTDYKFRVRGVNADGTSSNSNEVSVTTGVTTPTASAASAITQTGFTANWNSVSCATGYYLDVASDAGFLGTLGAYDNLPVSGTSQSVIGLSSGTTYYYRVRSTNAGGTSANSNTISTITLPADPTATAASSITQNSFTANWNSVTGASSYDLDVAADSGFGSIVGSFTGIVSTSKNVTTLGAGTAYYYRVTAVNASGSSLVSNTISTITLPANPTATAASSITQSSFTANWNSVSGAGSYTLEVATDSGFGSIVASFTNIASTSKNVTALSPGTTYYYRVKSVNTTGASFASNSVTTITLPGNPTATAADLITTSSFRANWITVSGASSYNLDVATDSGFGSIIASFTNVSATFKIVTSLIGGTAYYYRVTAVDASGNSFPSNTINTITLPFSPTATAATSITQSSFTANWNAITGASSYDLDVATSSGFGIIFASFANVTSTSQLVTGLATGVTYYYRVRAVNASGSSINSNTISATTVSGVPTATAASAITQTSFDANWSSALGATSYNLEVATDSGFGTIIGSYPGISLTSKTVPGLTAGTTYYYHVKAVNGSGTSAFSNTISVILVPPDPTATVATAIGQSSFTANWNAVTSASSYYLDVATDAALSNKLPSFNNNQVNGLSQFVSGLSSGTTYYYQVRSTNASGTSQNSNVISTITIPADPTASAATAITTTGFTANWNLVTGASGYNLDVAKDAGFTSILSNFAVSGNSQVVTSLTDGTTYYYRVKSNNASGSSSSSNVISLQTEQAQVTKAIPTLLSGGTQESYSMFSIPLALQNGDSTIATLFNSLGDYTPDKWRLLRWNPGASSWDEYQKGLTTIDRGKSYWFNAVDPVSISVTGKSFIKSSFALKLNPGWNQIGSPYNFDVSWSDVLAKNVSVAGVSLVESSLYKYASASKSFIQTDNLKAWGGGYVFNGGATITLKIPITVNPGNGRVSSGFNNESGTGAWFLPLALRSGDTENNYSGIGMHPEAIASYDKFDGITVPRFVNYLELNSYHPDFFEPYFARDVVSTGRYHNWHFMAESNLPNDDAVLTWNSQLVGDNESQLLLFDPATGTIVDMKQSTQYHFKVGGKHLLHFFYAADKESLRPDVTTLATVYPNPVITTVTFPIFIADMNGRGQIEIYDTMGKSIRSIGNGIYDSGLHIEQWDCTDQYGSRVPPGMYVYKFIGEKNLIQTGKLIVK